MINNNPDQSQISVTHIEIHQSVWLLLFRLMLLEVLAASLLLLWFRLANMPEFTTLALNLLFSAPLFLLLVGIKLLIMSSIVLQWLSNYYHLSLSEISHRKGLLIKQEEAHNLDHLSSLDFKQNFIGKLFNFGTLELYNWTLEKYFLLYDIHNPQKYYFILKKLIPAANHVRELPREKMIDEDESLDVLIQSPQIL